MQNIQELKDKIFFESKNIIDILSKTNHVDELISKHDLLNELVEKMTFLRLLDQNLNYNADEKSNSSRSQKNEVFTSENFVKEDEDVFNNQLDEIIGTDFHDKIVNISEQNEPEANADFISDEISDHLQSEEELFLNQSANGNEEDEEKENTGSALDFSDHEEPILEKSKSEKENDFNEDLNTNREEEATTSSTKEIENEIIPDIFEKEIIEEEPLIEENENEGDSKNINANHEETSSEDSVVENSLEEIKEDSGAESPIEVAEIKNEDSEKSPVSEVEKPNIEIKQENLISDESLENLDAYRKEKKIKLAHIRGIKAAQTLFDDESFGTVSKQEKEEVSEVKESHNKPDSSENEKQRPEFRLDLNDRIAFTKVLFGGSQTDMNHAVSELNRCRNLEEAKEFLSDLYYDKKWEKVDEYAQRLWILVENKFI